MWRVRHIFLTAQRLAAKLSAPPFIGYFYGVDTAKGVLLFSHYNSSQHIVAYTSRDVDVYELELEDETN